MSLPEWARTGNYTYCRFDGGPAEVAKANLTGWDYMSYPVSVEACGNLYDDPRALGWLDMAGINWVWLTWSVGFSWEAEAVQREKCARFVEKFHAAGGHCTAYMSLANIFIETFEQDEPDARDLYQYDIDGNPVPYGEARKPGGRVARALYGEAQYFGGRVTRILACMNNPRWAEYQYRRIDAAIEAGFDAILWDNVDQQLCRSCQVCSTKLAEYSRQVLGRGLTPDEVRAPPQPGGPWTVRAEDGLAALEADDATGGAEILRYSDEETTSGFLAKMMARARDRKPDIVMCCNAHQVASRNNPMNSISLENYAEPYLLGEGESLDLRKLPWRAPHPVGLERPDRRCDNLELYALSHEETEGYKAIRAEAGKRRAGSSRFRPDLEPRLLARSIYECAMLGGTLELVLEGMFLGELHQEKPEALQSMRAAGTANRFLLANRDAFYETVGLPDMPAVLRGRGEIEVEVSDSERVVAIPVKKAGEDRYFVRVLNYDDSDVEKLSLTIRGIPHPARASVIVEPEYGGSDVRASVENDTVHVRFERLGLFAVVVVEA